MANLTADLLGEESVALEAVVTALQAAGPAQQRIEEALALLKDRIRALRTRLAESESSAEQAGVPRLEPWPGPPERVEGAALIASPYASLVGRSEAMKQVYQAIRRVSESQATVLLRGESGTGKELVAKAIHVQGARAKAAFVRLHCAALTETLLESELFGHERGAFTGAVETRKGRFELADEGTLFLDEIGDIPPSTQVKLLRVLQEKCFERVGGSRPIAVDVRVISATHRDLEAMVRTGSFREDLYYRLNVVPVTLPPLREREGDIPLLIDHFLARFNRENRRQVRLGRDLLALMGRYHWPGNVRELQNCVERLVVMAEQERVALDLVPPSLRGYFADMKQVTSVPREAASDKSREAEPLGASLQEIERRRLLEALERSGWVQAKAARALGLTPRQVAYKVRKYQIGPEEL
jgi:Nif-specific regulatory protein